MDIGVWDTRFVDALPTAMVKPFSGSAARARALLLSSESQVRDIALACGFASAAHFSKCYSRLFGVSPIGERKQVALH